MYFAAATQFEDKFEGATSIINTDIKIYPDNIQFNLLNKAFKELQRLTKINCWHKSEKESNLMWN